LYLRRSLEKRHRIVMRLTTRFSAVPRCRSCLRSSDTARFRRRHARFLSAQAGLFGIKGLLEPQDFLRLAKQAYTEAERIRAEIRDDGTHPLGANGVLSAVDRLSNVICKTVDPAELCRQVHADASWRAHAEAAFTALNSYINVLNTDLTMYKALKRICDDPETMESLRPEQRRLATVMLAELQHGGIHLGDEEKAEFLQLSEEVTRLESEFQKNLNEHSLSITVRGGRQAMLQLGVPLIEGRNAAQQKPPSEDATIPATKLITNAILRMCDDEAIRKQVYLGMYSGAHPNVGILQKLMVARHQCAQLLGFPTHAHRVTAETMAGSPGNVVSFLEDLQERLRPLCLEEQKTLKKLKRIELGRKGASEALEILPWDVQHYVFKARLSENLEQLPDLSKFFAFSKVLAGLTELLSMLFGLELRLEEMTAQEKWDGSGAGHSRGLHKLGFFEDGKRLATMYMDILPRRMKYSHSAHFTIQCGCATDHHKPDAEYQIPSVALVFSFGGNAPATPDGEVYLQHSEVETLFHEFGHALHSALSRTQYQHLSGTRVPVDFVETPSHLFEYFAWDPRVLERFAVHGDTKELIPSEVLESLRKNKGMFAGIDAQRQVFYALADQHLFGDRAAKYMNGEHQSTESGGVDLYEVANGFEGNAMVETGAWFAHFGHFMGYSAGYYGYVLARVFASQIWGDLFEGNPFSKASGRKVWHDLLATGNTKDAKEILRDLLGKEPTPDRYLEELQSSSKA